MLTGVCPTRLHGHDPALRNTDFAFPGTGFCVSDPAVGDTPSRLHPELAAQRRIVCGEVPHPVVTVR